VKVNPTIRRTSRVLLVDQSDRLLLFQGQDPSNPTNIYWCPIGGGIEIGESPEDAARREVLEETGLNDFDLGSHIWNRLDKYSFNGTDYEVSETWFLSRVTAFEIDTSALFGLERSAFLRHHWWTQEELDSTSEVMMPVQLATLFRDLIQNGPPDTPLDFGLD
jgi:8-oxo-dGTP pyrophosphatase MutT (NUDIX family)